MSVDIKRILKMHAYQNVPLWYDQAFALGRYALAGCAGDELAMVQSVTALSALHTRATYEHVGDGVATPESAAEQIAGICAAIFEHDIRISQFGFLEPRVSYVMDNCGMGGDLVVTANVSTLAGFIAATAGIPMCKHGSPGNTDRHGSSDFVALCGIKPDADRQLVEESVERWGFGYTEALDTRFKHIHRQTHTFAQLPHMNDIIGPITNPVHPRLMTRRVIGVNHLVSPRLVAHAYQILNEKGVTDMQQLYAVRGYVDTHSHTGMDEVSICAGGTEVAELSEGHVRSWRLDAGSFGLAPVLQPAISPSRGVSKGDFSLSILHGEATGGAMEMVLANAALLFMLADKTLSHRSAYEAARDTLASGRVPQTVEAVGAHIAAPA